MLANFSIVPMNIFFWGNAGSLSNPIICCATFSPFIICTVRKNWTRFVTPVVFHPHGHASKLRCLTRSARSRIELSDPGWLLSGSVLFGTYHIAEMTKQDMFPSRVFGTGFGTCLAGQAEKIMQLNGLVKQWGKAVTPSQKSRNVYLWMVFPITSTTFSINMESKLQSALGSLIVARWLLTTAVGVRSLIQRTSEGWVSATKATITWRESVPASDVV